MMFGLFSAKNTIVLTTVLSFVSTDQLLATLCQQTFLLNPLKGDGLSKLEVASQTTATMQERLAQTIANYAQVYDSILESTHQFQLLNFNNFFLSKCKELTIGNSARQLDCGKFADAISKILSAKLGVKGSEIIKQRVTNRYHEDHLSFKTTATEFTTLEINVRALTTYYVSLGTANASEYNTAGKPNLASFAGAEALDNLKILKNLVDQVLEQTKSINQAYDVAFALHKNMIEPLSKTLRSIDPALAQSSDSMFALVEPSNLLNQAQWNSLRRYIVQQIRYINVLKLWHDSQHEHG